MGFLKRIKIVLSERTGSDTSSTTQALSDEHDFKRSLAEIRKEEIEFKNLSSTALEIDESLSRRDGDEIASLALESDIPLDDMIPAYKGSDLFQTVRNLEAHSEACAKHFPFLPEGAISHISNDSFNKGCGFDQYGYDAGMDQVIIPSISSDPNMDTINWPELRRGAQDYIAGQVRIANHQKSQDEARIKWENEESRDTIDDTPILLECPER